MGFLNWGKQAKDAGEGVESAGKGVKTALDGVGNLAGSIRSAITGDLPPATVEKLTEIAAELEKISRQGQIEINRVEAGSSSIFVAGWRPMIGWVGGVSLGLYFIPQFISANVFWILNMIESKVLQPFPVTPDGILELVLGLLGLGMMRSAEKIGGVQNNH